jgi:hypothetical protein
MSAQCGYCGRYMALVDYGVEYGTGWVCSRQTEHIVADPEHWTIGSLDQAVRIAKIRSGVDPDMHHLPAVFIEHLDAEWRPQFWEHQLDRVIAASAVSEVTQ